MKIISESKATRIAQNLLDLISSMIVRFEDMNRDLEYEFGKDILTRKIGKGFKDGRCKYSLRDRYGAICDKLLNTSIEIAKSLSVEEKEFREAIDEVIGNSRVYNGEYDSYTSVYPSVDSLELEKGYKRWWKPKIIKSENNL